MRKGIFTATLLGFVPLALLPASAQMFGGDYRTPAVSQPNRLEWAWDGGDRLAIGVPATVRYSEQGAPRVIVTGPEELLRRVRFRDGSISNRDDWGFSWGRQERLEIQVTGVKLNNFLVSGSARMLLGKLERDSLHIRVSGSGSAVLEAAKVRDISMKVSGSGEIQAGTLESLVVEIESSGSGTASGAGRAERIELKISGSGTGRFAGLQTKEAEVTLSGSGNAAIAPRDAAKIRISGSGHVRMPTSPPRVESTISGSGRVDTGKADIN